MDNYKKILESALDLFYSKGYDATGVQEISERSGVTKPTLYHYFGSKYGLLESLLKTYMQDYEGSIEESIPVGGDVQTTLYKLVKIYFNMALTQPKFYSVFMTMLYSAEDSDLKKAILPYASRQIKLFTEVFLNAQPAIGNMKGRQEQYAITMIGMINHYIILCKTRGCTEMLSDEGAYAVVHQFLHGIYV